jgi:hypothetical protein
MPQPPVDRVLEAILLALQVLQIVFLWVHDWIPLGRLNEVIAVRGQNTLGRLVMLHACTAATLVVLFARDLTS